MASTFSIGSGYQPTGFSGALSAGQSYYAPEQQNYDMQRSSLMRQLGYGDAQYGVDQQLLRQQFADTQNQLGIDQGTNAIDLAAAQRLLPYYDNLLGLSDQMLQSQMAGFNVNEDQARAGAKQDTWSLMQDAAARGSLSGPGTGTRRGFIDENLYNNLRGIMENKNQATISNTKEKLGLYEDKAQANDRIARLNLEAQGLGMKSDSLKKQLELGLQKLGIQHMMSANDIFDALNSNNYQSSLLARQIMNDAVQYASLPGATSTTKTKTPMSAIPPGMSPQQYMDAYGFYATGGY